MTLLSFPDVNVWLALVSHEHVHSASAAVGGTHRAARSHSAAFRSSACFACLHSGVMNGNRFRSTRLACLDSLLVDERVVFSRTFRRQFFRTNTTGPASAQRCGPMPGCWRCRSASGVLVTFDKALAARGAHACCRREAETASASDDAASV